MMKAAAKTPIVEEEETQQQSILGEETQQRQEMSTIQATETIKKNKTTTTTPQWREAVAGACAGAFSKTAVAPVERIKLVLQVQGLLTTTQKQQPQQQQRTAWQVAKMIYENEGMLAFWRGNLSNVIRTSGTAGINFMMMDYYKKVAVIPPFLFQQQEESTTTTTATRKRKLVTSFLSGGLAGGTSTTILYPIEFIRTRLGADLKIIKSMSQQETTTPKTSTTSSSSSSTYKFGGIRHTCISIYQSDGIRGFYQGYGIALAGSVFYRLLLLGSYDALKEELPKIKQQPLTWLERMFVAQTVSLVSGTMVYPIDSVRRRLMMQAGLPLSERLYKHSIHCFVTVWKTEGLKGFYLGLGPNILRSIGGAILLVAYDACKVVLF